MEHKIRNLIILTTLLSLSLITGGVALADSDSLSDEDIIEYLNFSQVQRALAEVFNQHVADGNLDTTSSASGESFRIKGSDKESGTMDFGLKDLEIPDGLKQISLRDLTDQQRQKYRELISSRKPFPASDSFSDSKVVDEIDHYNVKTRKEESYFLVRMVSKRKVFWATRTFSYSQRHQAQSNTNGIGLVVQMALGINKDFLFETFETVRQNKNNLSLALKTGNGSIVQFGDVDHYFFQDISESSDSDSSSGRYTRSDGRQVFSNADGSDSRKGEIRSLNNGSKNTQGSSGSGNTKVQTQTQGLMQILGSFFSGNENTGSSSNPGSSSGSGSGTGTQNQNEQIKKTPAYSIVNGIFSLFEN
jgi:hypothetical protein